MNIKKLEYYIEKIGVMCLDDNMELKNKCINDKLNFVDSDGYKYNLSMQNLSTITRRDTKPAAFFSNNIYTHHNINNYLKINNINIKLLTLNPKNAICKLQWKCLMDDNIFSRSWNSVKNGSHMCDDCAKKSFQIKRCNSLDYIKEKAWNDYEIEITSEKYINNETPLGFICNKHRNESAQYKTWGNIISKNQHPCSYCAKEKYLSKVTKSHEDFVDEVFKIHKERYKVVSKYINCKSKVKVYCEKCKEYFEIKPSHLLEGHGCRKCIKSIGEQKIEDILLENDISFIREYRFDDCQGIKRKLPFDFYLEKYNLCIEYQGIQHYQPVERFGGEKSFKIQQQNDNYKRQYCNNNSIDLLEISYWQKNIEKVLLKKLNIIKEAI